MIIESITTNDQCDETMGKIISDLFLNKFAMLLYATNCACFKAVTNF